MRWIEREGRPRRAETDRTRRKADRICPLFVYGRTSCISGTLRVYLRVPSPSKRRFREGFQCFFLDSLDRLEGHVNSLIASTY